MTLATCHHYFQVSFQYIYIFMFNKPVYLSTIRTYCRSHYTPFFHSAYLKLQIQLNCNHNFKSENLILKITSLWMVFFVICYHQRRILTIIKHKWNDPKHWHYVTYVTFIKLGHDLGADSSAPALVKPLIHCPLQATMVLIWPSLLHLPQSSIP